MLYDFYEFLGRGIIAQRTGRSQEAIQYLLVAAQTEPTNPRVWLWLASSVKSIDQKRECLERALKLDPNLAMAQALLDRLDQRETVANQQSSDFVIFTCPYCGGKQWFDPDMPGLTCEYCHKTEPLTLENASDAESSFDDENQPIGVGNWAITESQVSCDSCGAKISIPPGQITHTCPFCSSEHVTVQSATPGIISPTAIVLFQYHSEDMKGILAKRWKMMPSQLVQLSETNKVRLTSIYLPFWTFDGRVQIRCALTYPVPPTTYSPNDRVITKGDWPMEKSWYECDIDDLTVYAGRSVADDAILQIPPFNLKAAIGYDPKVLVGWQAEFYQLALEDAAVEAHKSMRDVAFQRARSRRLFINPARLLEDDVCVFDKTYKLVLLPVWIARRITPNGIEQTLINGQTGEIAGKQKGNWLKIF